jgi:DNA-binding transcriptional LysR family regulator
MDRLHAMQVFVAVVDTRSISAAAVRLGSGQPAVSKTLAALEAHLGVTLLLRSTRGSALTEAGRRFLAHARTTLDEAEAAEVAARDEGLSLTGPLRIAAPPTYATQVIIPHLGEFRARHPGIVLDLLLDDRRIDMIAEGIDLALRGGRLDDSTVVARRVDRAEQWVVASRAYCERRGTPDHPRELPGHDFIEYTAWNAATWRFARGGVEEPVTVPATMRVSAAEALRAAVFAGLGCAIVSERMIQRALDNPALVRLLRDWTLPEGDFWLCAPAGRRMGAKARAFSGWLDEIVARMAGGGPPLS